MNVVPTYIYISQVKMYPATPGTYFETTPSDIRGLLSDFVYECDGDIKVEIRGEKFNVWRGALISGYYRSFGRIDRGIQNYVLVHCLEGKHFKAS